MPEKETLDELQGLSQDRKNRSQTARLAELLDVIEAQLEKGVRREVILASLQKHGFTLTLQGFQTALRRLRQKKAQRQAPKASSSPVPAPTQTQATPNPSSSKLSPSAPNQEKPSEATEEEDPEREAFRKKWAHLPLLQLSKKMATFDDQRAQRQPDPVLQRIIEKNSQ